MKGKKASYLWVIVLALIFPIVQDIIYLIRFGHITTQVLGESIYFIPMGLISGILLIYILRKNDGKRSKKFVIIGYILGSLCAIPISIASGLLFAPGIGIAIIGSLPIVVGTIIGYGFSS